MPGLSASRAAGLRARTRALALLIAAMPITMVMALLACPADARHGPRARDRTEAAHAVPARKPEGPLQIIVSIGSQRLWVYDSKGLLEMSTVSTGTNGYPTPTGVFAILDKERTHYSNIYGGASMPFMQRLTMSGVALHSGMVTGRPASHGCIRLPHPFAIKLYKLTELGARVVVAPNEPVPEEISHPRLFVHKPPPPPEPMDPAGTKAVAVAAATDMTTAVANARVGKITAWRTGVLQALPISVLVSRAEGKVYVRHGFRQVFEAPAVVSGGDQPLGTHVFTALEFKDGSEGMRWNAITVAASGREEAKGRKISRAFRSEAEPPFQVARGPASTAAQALDRIELPTEAVERISQMISPGASLIVTDHGHNREMRAAGTDFIVLTR